MEKCTCVANPDPHYTALKVCLFYLFIFFWSNLHPFELLVGREGSSRNAFNQVLLQTTEREKGRSEGERKKKKLDLIKKRIKHKLIECSDKKKTSHA